MSKVLRADLSESGIQRLIDQLEEYSKSLESKAQRLRERIAEVIRWSAEDGFTTALTSDIFTGGEPPLSDVMVTVEDDGDLTIVIAQGEQAVFIEFGAGVYYNGGEGMVGKSPHEWGEEKGFLIGEYGIGHGKQNVWALPGSTREEPILTHGTPAAMPMYHGVQDALAVMADLAREVFSEE